LGVGGDDTPTARDDARKIVRSTATWLPTDNGIEVRPGDPSGAAEVEGWFRDYVTGRDPHLRERIILAYLGLADRLAARYRASHGTTLEDLTQTARAGLIAAVDRYDPGHRGGFVPFAVASVVGELKRYLRDTSWRVHVPRPLKDRTLQLRRAVDELQQALGRPPTTMELADHLRLPVEQVLEGLDAAMSRSEVSLDQPVGEDDEGCLGDLLAAPDPREEPEDLLVLAGLIAKLPELERTVVVLRFFRDLDQSAIAARIGYSQMHVSRLLRRALARMRAQLLEP
jgi:RNA polymerase sigma-B factor